MTTQNKIISYFLRHPDFFKKSIETRFPFNKEDLRKYHSVLDWKKLSQNESIPWDAKLIHRYKDRLDWEYFTINAAAFKDVSLVDEFKDYIEWNGKEGMGEITLASNQGLFWSAEFINKYNDLLDFEHLSENEQLPWTIELLERYYDRWYTPHLAQNNALPWSLDFFEKYFINHRLHNCYFTMNDTLHGIFEIVEKWNCLFDWHNIWGNPYLPWIEKDLINRWRHNIQWYSIACNEFLLSQENFMEEHFREFLNTGHAFHNLSTNEGLPWTVDLLERYEGLWYWDQISLNELIPWNIRLIEKYSDRLVWGGYERHIPPEPLNVDDGGWCSVGTLHSGLVTNKGLPWSADFILHFENEIDDEMLYLNTAAWEKAFRPYVDEKLIEIVLGII